MSAIAVTTEKERAQRERQLARLDEKELRERMSKRNNPRFVQMYEENIVYIRELIDKNPLAAKVFLFLSEKMDKLNAVVCPTQVLCEVFGKSRQTLERSIRFLRENGYVYTTKAGQTNVYHLNKDLVWKSWNTNKEYCEFQGTILVAKSENKDVALDIKKMTCVDVK